MSTKVKIPDIKKRVVRGASLSYGPVPLYVNEHGGEWWATNRYWITRASRVAPLLSQYNLPADAPGAFEVNGTVRRADGQARDCAAVPPSLASFMKDARGYAPGIRVHAAGMPALVQPDDRSPLYAVYQTGGGTHAGLIAEELAWLADLATAPELPESHRYGDVRVSFHRSANGNTSAMVTAEAFKVLERGHYEDGGRGDWVPAVEEAAEPVLLGLTMAMNLSA